MKLLRGARKIGLSILVDLIDIFRKDSKPTTLVAKEALSHQVLVRWGDGETSLAYGNSTRFQCANKCLADELRQLVRCDSPDVILCFPTFLQKSFLSSKSPIRSRIMWAETAFLMRRLSRVPNITADPFMFRKESDFSGVTELQNIIREAEKIVLISAHSDDVEKISDRLQDRIRSKRVIHIKSNKENAYSQRSELSEILKALDRPDLLLLSAGPVGKCLALEFKEYWGPTTKIIDTGHLFDQLNGWQQH